MFKKKTIDKWLVYYPEGRIDVQASKELEEDISKEIGADKRYIIFNMSNVEYMSSSGIRVLIFTLRQFNDKEGELRLCCVNDAVRNIIRIVDLENMFPTFETEEDALF